MGFAELARSRRMVRSFSLEPVPREVLDGILESALRSPTAGNSAGWSAVTLEGPDQTKLFWDMTTDSRWRHSSRRWGDMSQAPVIVVVLCRPGAYTERYAEPDKVASGLGSGAHPDDLGSQWPVPYWFVDAGMAIYSMLVAAVDAGLGSGFLGNFRGEEALLGALGVPGGWRYVGAVLIGRPAGDDPPSSSSTRRWRVLDEVVHRGRW